MTLPSAIVIGPKKAGTTWIHEYLRQRGDVGLPSGVKETFYFDKRFDRGVNWYANHFTSVPQDACCVVEVAPSYFECNLARQRVLETLGQVPLICTLRDPVERAFSLYLHMRRFGVTRKPFREAIVERPEILDSSRYYTHLLDWRDTFGGDRLLILPLEMLKSSAQTYANAICNHLGIDESPVPKTLNQSVNAAAVPAIPILARAAKRASDKVRSWGFYGPVNFAKSLRLKSVLFGKPGKRQPPTLSPEDASWLRAEIADEMELLGIEFAVDVSDWLPASSITSTT